MPKSIKNQQKSAIFIKKQAKIKQKQQKISNFMPKTIKNELLLSKNKQKSSDFDQKRLEKSKNRSKTINFMSKTIKNDRF